MLGSERDNIIKWNGKEAPFYEVYYLKVNDLSFGTALWLRFTLTVPVATPSEVAVWAIFFGPSGRHVALKEVVPMRDFVYRRGRFNMDVGGAILRNDGSSGRLLKDGCSIEWDLSWVPAEVSFKHYPTLLYMLPWPSSKVVAPNLSVRAIGSFTVNGRQYNLTAAPLHQGHIWGRHISDRWAWANCAAFEEDETAVLELLSRPPIGLGYLKTANSRLRFRFRGYYNPTSWEFEGRRLFTKIKGRISTIQSDIVGVTYDDPDYSKRYCYNTKVADAYLEIYRKGLIGWRLEQRLTSQHATAFETVESIPNESIPLWL